MKLADYSARIALVAILADGPGGPPNGKFKFVQWNFRIEPEHLPLRVVEHAERNATASSAPFRNVYR